MLLTRFSTHPEQPSAGQLQTYPAVLHNLRVQKQALPWAWSKQAMVALQGKKKMNKSQRLILLSNNKHKGTYVLLPHTDVSSLLLPM